MYADISKPPAPLPSARLQILRPGVSLQPPLTRRGHGPPLIILTTADETDEVVTHRDDAPTAVLKWAEEGYTVIQISSAAIESRGVQTLFTEALEAANKCDACQPKEKAGLICQSTIFYPPLPDVSMSFKKKEISNALTNIVSQVTLLLSGTYQHQC